MKYFLYSLIGAAVKVGGEYAGVIDRNVKAIKTEKLIEFDFGDNIEKALFCPENPLIKENVKIIDLYEGILLVSAIKRKRNLRYKSIFNGSGYCLGKELYLSIVSDGSVKLKAKTRSATNTVELPFEPLKVNMSEYGEYVIIDAYKSSHILIGLRISDLKLCFFTVCDDYSLKNGISVIKNHYDTLCHRTVSYFKAGAPFEPLGSEVFVNSPFSSLPTELIPYAFLEEVILGGDYRTFLSNELKSDAPLLAEYIGKFDLIIPPILEDKKELILIEGQKAKYAKISVSENKVCEVNIR